MMRLNGQIFSAEWSPDSSGFFYRKYLKPDGDELLDLNSSPKLMFHVIGPIKSMIKL